MRITASFSPDPKPQTNSPRERNRACRDSETGDRHADQVISESFNPRLFPVSKQAASRNGDPYSSYNRERMLVHDHVCRAIPFSCFLHVSFESADADSTTRRPPDSTAFSRIATRSGPER